MESNNTNFSLLRLMAEVNLNRKVKVPPLTDETKLSAPETKNVILQCSEIFDKQPITIDDIQYEVMGINVQNDGILLWVWSDSADEDKTIKRTMRIDNIAVESEFWDE